jgi:hypothetical protein
MSQKNYVLISAFIIARITPVTFEIARASRKSM